MARTNRFSKLLSDPNYSHFANTHIQKAYLAAFIEHDGNSTKAAETMNVSRQSLEERLQGILNKAVAHSYEPEKGFEAISPETHTYSGFSTLKRFPENDPQGRVIEWQKTKPDEAMRWKFIENYIDKRCQGLPAYDKIPKPKNRLASDLLNMYTLADAHIGMLAWGKETGADWDLSIAYDTIVKCFAYMLANSPNSEECLIVDLGDWLHYDSLLPVTPSSGHVVDADGRVGKMADVAMDLVLVLVNMALKKHDRVRVMFCEGNHNLYGSVLFRKMFKIVYRDNPRVEVCDGERPYYCHTFGDNMLAFHHGHIRKMEQLPLKFATLFSEQWGNAKHRYGHTGHLHHLKIENMDGIIMQQHGTLAAPDSHASRGAWFSQRQASFITYHKNYGEINHQFVTPPMAGVEMDDING